MADRTRQVTVPSGQATKLAYAGEHNYWERGFIQPLADGTYWIRWTKSPDALTPSNGHRLKVTGGVGTFAFTRRIDDKAELGDLEIYQATGGDVTVAVTVE